MDRLANASTNMQQKLHFIEDAETNPAILEAYDKVNHILTAVDTELKRVCVFVYLDVIKRYRNTLLR